MEFLKQPESPTVVSEMSERVAHMFEESLRLRGEKDAQEFRRIKDLSEQLEEG